MITWIALRALLGWRVIARVFACFAIVRLAVRAILTVTVLARFTIVRLAVRTILTSIIAKMFSQFYVPEIEQLVLFFYAKVEVLTINMDLLRRRPSKVGALFEPFGTFARFGLVMRELIF